MENHLSTDILMKNTPITTEIKTNIKFIVNKQLTKAGREFLLQLHTYSTIQNPIKSNANTEKIIQVPFFIKLHL